MYRIGRIPSIPYYLMYIKFVGFLSTLPSLIYRTTDLFFEHFIKAFSSNSTSLLSPIPRPLHQNNDGLSGG